MAEGCAEPKKLRVTGDANRVTGENVMRPTLSLALDAPSHFRSEGVDPKDWPWNIAHKDGFAGADRWLAALYVVAEMLRRSDSSHTVLQVIDAVLSAPDKDAPGVVVVSEEWAIGQYRQRCQAEDALSKAEAAASGYYEDLQCLFNRLGIAPPASPEEHAAAMAAVKSALDAVRVTGYGARVTGVADRVSGGGDPGDEALGRPTTNEAAMIAEGSFRWGRLCLQRLEQLGQIATAPDGVDAGSLISKADKALLADLGLVVPKYGDRFRLTEKGLAAWRSIEDYLKRLAGYWWQEGDARSEPSPPAPSPFEASPEGAGDPGDETDGPSDAYAQCCLDYPGWQTLVRADVLYAFGLVERNIIGRFTLEALQSNVQLRHAMVIPIGVLKEFARREGWLLVPGEAVTFVERPEPSPEPGLPCGPDRATHDEPKGEGVACVDALYVPDRSNLGLHPADAAEQVAGRDL